MKLTRRNCLLLALAVILVGMTIVLLSSKPPVTLTIVSVERSVLRPTAQMNYERPHALVTVCLVNHTGRKFRYFATGGRSLRPSFLHIRMDEQTTNNIGYSGLPIGLLAGMPGGMNSYGIVRLALHPGQTNEFETALMFPEKSCRIALDLTDPSKTNKPPQWLPAFVASRLPFWRNTIRVETEVIPSHAASMASMRASNNPSAVPR